MNLIGLIIAIVGTGIAISGVTVAMFFWVRSEANNDRRTQAQDTKELRRELVEVMRSIDQEFKDFHNRIYKLEEKNK